VKSLNVYVCPSASGSRFPGNVYGWSGAYSYGINTALFSYPAGSTNDPLIAPQWSSSSIKNVATTIVLCDNGYTDATGEGDFQEDPPCWDTPYIPKPKHNGGINAAFYDGHAKWYNIKNIVWNWHTQSSAHDQEIYKMWRPAAQ
jgi:prepilin-type processing-associated H-X9-DG protein